MKNLSHQDRERAALELMTVTGLVAAELTALRVKHVCGIHSRCAGRTVRHALALPAALAQGGHARLVPMSTQARKAVLTILAVNDQTGSSIEPNAPLVPGMLEFVSP